MDNSKTLDFLQDSGVIPNSTRKDCIFCRNEKCIVLRKTSKQIIPYTLQCLQCNKGVIVAKIMWFEVGYITIKQSLGLIYLWLHDITGCNAADELGVTRKTVYDYYGYCREVCYVIVTNSDNVIGGEGKIMQIDDSHIYTRKYHRTFSEELRKTDLGI